MASYVDNMHHDISVLLFIELLTQVFGVASLSGGTNLQDLPALIKN